ncbi:DedA family protein [Corynebacterium flavescens]|uniref:DedA family protein n=1 Tax=Corynebacterium flavescens TaxID=28028 RepID=UPI0026477A1B|nr:DedA family protein [Corynebacterium flavescens]MDN6199506.1 DedA family protein [Corynebacterium flavescens]MDN6431085.1 DedA family protein [Corynebacterium flavescens]MDN6460383.1 DedA family protein [Corynebacterium flavescens]MDN6474930.1 DedA family protein [Corynebacterium flavescens]MDN6531254.1 DedA family protein [Corynebacterium flavescens]
MIASITAWIEAVMLTHWVYPLVGTLIFFDCFFPVLPSEIPLNMVGAWSGSQGIPHVPTMFFVAVVAAIMGDNLCFLLGTRLMGLVNRVQKGSRAYEGLAWVKRNMRRGGGAAIIIARFIPSARLFMTILLGSMRYPWPLFFFFDAIGVAIWAAQALAIGYVGGMAFSDSPALAMVISIIAAVIIGFGLQRGQNALLEWWDTRRGYAETP